MSLSLAEQPGVVFGVAAVLSWLAHRLRVPHVIFLLLAGAALGVDGAGWWRDAGAFEAFSHIGIAALLFLVGLELSPAFFREVGWRPVRLLVQQLLCLGVLGGLWVSGFTSDVRLMVFVGVLFTFNSTMLALKTLGERQELGKTHGRLVTSVLILQDVVASTVLVGVTMLAAFVTGQEWTSVAGWYLLKLLAFGCLAWLFAEYALSRVWRSVAKQHDVFILAGFAYPLVIGVLFSFVGLSAELGALVAGISLSRSTFRFELLTRMKPLREIFLAPFFLAAGASWMWRSLPDVGFQVLFGWMIVGGIGPLFLFWRARGSEYSRQTAFLVASSLSHGSEFVFLVLALLGPVIAIPPSLQTALISVVILSLVSGSVIMQWAPKGVAILRRYWPERVPVQAAKPASAELVLFGCHRVGSDFLPVLKRLKRPFVVVDMDPRVIQDLTEHRMNAWFGDLGNRELLEELHVERAKLVVSTVHDREAQISLLRYLRRHRVKPLVIMVAHEIEEALELYKHGASYVILPHFLGGNYASQLIDVHGYRDPEPFEVERLRHVEHLKKRGKTGIFLPFTP